MLEDDDDKVRRNLLVFSAAIIAVAVFELPISDIAAAIVDRDQTGAWHLNSTRAWSVALAVLAYLWLRFHFSQIGRESIWKMAQAQQFDLSTRQGAYLDHITRAALDGDQAYSAVADSISELAAQHLATAQGLHPGEQFESVKRSLVHSQATKWSGRSTINFETVSTGSRTPRAHTGARDVSVPFSAAVRIWLPVVTFVKAWIWSETAIVYFVPLMLAMAALGVCVAKMLA
jgi:hypothetical protein